MFFLFFFFGYSPVLKCYIFILNFLVNKKEKMEFHFYSSYFYTSRLWLLNLGLGDKNVLIFQTSLQLKYVQLGSAVDLFIFCLRLCIVWKSTQFIIFFNFYRFTGVLYISLSITCQVGPLCCLLWFCQTFTKMKHSYCMISNQFGCNHNIKKKKKKLVCILLWNSIVSKITW